MASVDLIVSTWSKCNAKINRKFKASEVHNNCFVYCLLGFFFFHILFLKARSLKYSFLGRENLETCSCVFLEIVQNKLVDVRGRYKRHPFAMHTLFTDAKCQYYIPIFFCWITFGWLNFSPELGNLFCDLCKILCLFISGCLAIWLHHITNHMGIHMENVPI